MKSKKAVSFYALVLAAALIFVGCSTKSSSSTGAADSKTVRIAIVTSLSGSDAGHGQYAKEGAELWKNEVNKKGGILGKQVEIVYEDYGETDQQFMNAMLKAMSKDNVSAVYSNGFTNQAQLVSPEVKKYQIPFVSGASSATLVESDNPYMWLFRLTDKQVSPAMVKACKNIGMKKPAVIHVADSYGQSMSDYVVKAIKDSNMTVACNISVNASEKQFTPFLTQIVSSGADGIIAINHQDQASVVMMQAASMGLKIPMMGCSQYATSLAIDTAGDAANGWYSLADWTNEVETEPGKTFVQNYRKTYNREADMQSACSYDAMEIIADAITKAGTTEPKAVNEALKKVKDLKGVMTSYTHENNNALGETIFLVQTKEKKGSLINIIHR